MDLSNQLPDSHPLTARIHPPERVTGPPELHHSEGRYLLVQHLQLAKADYTLAKALNKLDPYALLVFDDIGYVRKDEAETSVLFELVMHRYKRRCLLAASNQPISEWENVFSTSAMTVAALDSLVEQSTSVQIHGESYRRKQARRSAP